MPSPFVWVAIAAWARILVWTRFESFLIALSVEWFAFLAIWFLRWLPRQIDVAFASSATVLCSDQLLLFLCFSFPLSGNHGMIVLSQELAKSLWASFWQVYWLMAKICFLLLWYDSLFLQSLLCFPLMKLSAFSQLEKEQQYILHLGWLRQCQQVWLHQLLTW